MGRLKENKKITKKGRKIGRSLLEEELKDISVAGLVGYILKTKNRSLES